MIIVQVDLLCVCERESICVWEREGEYARVCVDILYLSGSLRVVNSWRLLWEEGGKHVRLFLIGFAGVSGVATCVDCWLDLRY